MVIWGLNHTSCDQVHGFPQSHWGDNREGTLYTHIHLHIFIFIYIYRYRYMIYIDINTYIYIYIYIYIYLIKTLWLNQTESVRNIQ